MKILFYKVLKNIGILSKKVFIFKFIIYFTKGSGKIFFLGLFDLFFKKSVLNSYFLLKYIIKNNILNMYDIYISSYNLFINSGNCSSLSFFFSFLSFFLKLNIKKIFFIGNVNKSGDILRVGNIKKKINFAFKKKLLLIFFFNELLKYNFLTKFNKIKIIRIKNIINNFDVILKVFSSAGRATSLQGEGREFESLNT